MSHGRNTTQVIVTLTPDVHRALKKKMAELQKELGIDVALSTVARGLIVTGLRKEKRLKKSDKVKVNRGRPRDA